MTVNGSSLQCNSCQGYSFSSLRVTVFQATATTQGVSMQQPGATDTVTLSPEATTAAGVPADPAEPVAQAPGFEGATTGAAPQSRAERQADALFAALDTDQDGSITKDEFTEGAAALLRRARGGHHYRRAHGEQGDDHESRGAGRLERKLGRVFDRVDADDDGGVTKDELVAALSGGRDGSAPADATPPATAQASASTSAVAPAPVPSPAPAALGTTTISVSFVSVTFVSFAVQSYSTVGQLAPLPAPAAESQPLEQPSA